MIVLEDIKSVIFTPPKTGSQSLHVALCQHGPSIWVVGPTPNNIICKHTTHLPYWCTDYAKYIVVRDPVERYLSFYWHAYHLGDEPWKNKSFEYFKEKIFDINDPWFCSCISYRRDASVIPYDYVPGTLESLDVKGVDVYKTLRLNTFKKHNIFLSQATKDHINWMYKDDTEALQKYYDKESKC